MKFIIEGSGSIGQRHYKNLKLLGHEVAFLRSGPKVQNRPFVQNFLDQQAQEGVSVLEFFSFEDAVAEFNPDGWIVANPNALHPASAERVLLAGIPVLIEKPIGDSVDSLKQLQEISLKKNVPVLVGYNLRFHPLLQKIKIIVDSGELGNILSANVEVGENIIDWHPWENYAETYAPYVSYGGGSLLCFSHDIDYLYWLLGSPDTVYATGGKITELAGDAEDLVQGLWWFKEKKQTAMLHIDYWQRPKVRTLKLVGIKKTALWDYYSDLKVFDHVTGDVNVFKVPDDFERNKMFIDEVSHFVDIIQGRASPLISLQDGVEVVRIVDLMKKKLYYHEE